MTRIFQIGKGRDVGFNQINTFEAKVSSGNGEQVLSRQLSRLANALDYARTLSLYYTTVGFYVANFLIVCIVFVYLYGLVSGIKCFVIAAIVANAKFAHAMHHPTGLHSSWRV